MDKTVNLELPYGEAEMLVKACLTARYHYENLYVREGSSHLKETAARYAELYHKVGNMISKIWSNQTEDEDNG